jgi:hypothetical protein
MARSPEREALGAAIVKRDAVQAEVSRVSAALHHAEAARFAAFRELDDARMGLAEARKNAAIDAASRVLGEPLQSNVSVVDLRREIERLESEHAEAKMLLGALEQRLFDAKGSLDLAELGVDGALCEALQVDPAVEAAVAAFRASVQAFVKHEATMRHLFKAGAIPPSLRFAAQLCENDRQGNSPDARWVEAIAALSRDADTPLP